MSASGVILTYILCYFIYCIYRFLTALRTMGHVPGMRVLLSPMSIAGAVLPTSWWNPGLEWNWKWRATGYFNRKQDVITVIPFLTGKPVYFTAAPGVIRQVLMSEHNTRLIKHEEIMKPFLQWGGNLISANGEEWKRHRRIVAAGFSNKTYASVMQETASVYEEIIQAKGWASSENVVRNINEIIYKLALHIVSRCALGMPLSWAEWDESSDRSSLARLGFQVAYQQLDYAWTALPSSMRSLVEERKRELEHDSASEPGDILSRMVAALDPDSTVGLEEQEVIGNIYALMFAGSETSAHVLSATIAMLAVHQEEQMKAYQEVIKVFPRHSEITAELLSELPYLTMCFWEALRIFPSGSTLPRDMAEDVSVRVTHPREEVFVFPKGSRLIIDMIAAGHDPHTFPDPDKFQPTRWEGISEPQVLLFGLGPRVCVGRKFARAEILTFLALFLRDWHLDVVFRDGESRTQCYQRILDSASRIGLSFGIGPVDLKLRRRTASDSV